MSGRLLLPRLNLSTNLSLLVDTGADRSTLMPADAMKMGVDYDQLTDPVTVGGMGGDANCFQEPAVLLFHEPNRKLIRAYSVTIMIPEPHIDLSNMPPIVGRDVLDRWSMHYDPSRSKLSFTVRSADYTDKA